MDIINLKFMKEKKEGFGEDSEPLFVNRVDFCVVGAFDGMGGAGAATCKSEFGDSHTKAYVASRIIQKSITEFLTSVESPFDVNSASLKGVICNRFAKEKNDFPTKTSGLRTKLVREYPTTMAISMVKPCHEGGHVVTSFWAGDSRNYLWTKSGLAQISKDDLDQNIDPYQNLSCDAPMSNCLCADRDFTINRKVFKVDTPFVVFSTSDGCFNYYQTPMHFQDAMQVTLRESANEKEWEDKLRDTFGLVTADDMSFSLVAVGFDSFESMKRDLLIATINDLESCAANIQTYGLTINEYSVQIAKQEKEIEKLQKKVDEEKELVAIKQQEVDGKQCDLKLIEEKLDAIASEIDDFEDKIKIVQCENKDIQRQIECLREKMLSNENQASSCLTKIEADKNVFALTKDEQSKCEASLEQDVELLAKLKHQMETGVLSELNKLRAEKDEVARSMEAIKQQQKDVYQKSWEAYKVSYMALLSSPDYEEVIPQKKELVQVAPQEIAQQEATQQGTALGVKVESPVDTTTIKKELYSNTSKTEKLEMNLSSETIASKPMDSLTKTSSENANTNNATCIVDVYKENDSVVKVFLEIMKKILTGV